MKVCREKIQHFQDRKLWTDKKLAEESGVSCPTIYALKGRGSCSPETAGKLASALDVDVIDIMPQRR